MIGTPNQLPQAVIYYLSRQPKETNFMFYETQINATCLSHATVILQGALFDLQSML